MKEKREKTQENEVFLKTIREQKREIDTLTEQRNNLMADNDNLRERMVKLENQVTGVENTSLQLVNWVDKLVRVADRVTKAIGGNSK